MRGPPSAASDARNRRSAASNPPCSLVRSLCSLTPGVRLTARTAPFQGAGAGSAPARPTMPPGSAGDDAGFSDQKAGFDPPWRYSMRGSSRGRAPGRYPGGWGIVALPRSHDAWAGRQGTWLQPTSHSVRLRDASLCGGRSTARTSARQVDNQGSIPCRHTMRTSFKSRTPALQAGDAGATPVVRSIEPAGAPAGAVGLYPTAARAALDTGSAGP